MNENRGPFVSHQTKPSQMRPSRVTVEEIERDHVRVSGCYDVAIPGAEWRQRPEYSEVLEQEIEDAIRGVLAKYAER